MEKYFKSSVRTLACPGLASLSLGLCLFPVTGAAAVELLLERPRALERLVAHEDGRLTPVPLQDPPEGADELLMVSRHFRVPATGEAGESMQLTLPVPDFLLYLPGTAVGPGVRVLVSVDGGRVFEPDPGPGARLSAPVTHLRWVFTRPMEPGVSGQVRYRGLSRAPSGSNGKNPPAPR